MLARIASRRLSPCAALSQSNEAMVGDTLRALLESMGGAYPTTLEDDEARVQGEQVSLGARACLHHIISQKRIIRSNMRFVDEHFGRAGGEV